MAVRFDNEQWGTLCVPRSLRTVMDQITDFAPRKIAIETFIGMGYLSKYGIETMELIGAIKYYCLLHDVEMVRRTNVQRAHQMPEAIKLLRERYSGTKYRFENHEIDALAHLLSWEKYESRSK